jgi:molecular chaperone DnaK (HSP70)
VADPAERVIICVFEGDVYDNPDSPDNVKLAEIPWEFNPPRTQRDGALDVTFEYGDDGILTVQITDPHVGHKKRFAIQQSGADQMDAGQIMKMKRINEDLMKRGENLEQSQEYRDALEVLAPSVESSDESCSRHRRS